MKKTREILAGVVALALLATTALAATGKVTKALDYADIKITVNGVEVTPTDVNGNSTEPFAIDGTVYVPVRAISEALGNDVEWNGETATVEVTTNSETASTTIDDLGMNYPAGYTVVFEGSTGLICRESVKMMAAHGVNVVMVGHNPAGGQSLLAETADLPGEVVWMSNDPAPAEYFAAIAEEFGRIDAYITKCGTLYAPRDILSITEEDMAYKLDHQIAEPFEKIQAVIPYLEESDNGRLILFSNASASSGNPDYNEFTDAITGGAVETMTYYLANVLAESTCTVNCIAFSGMIDDSVIADDNTTSLRISDYEDSIPVGHAGTSHELGALILYLISEEAGFMTGNVLNFSGGLLIGD